MVKKTRGNHFVNLYATLKAYGKYTKETFARQYNKSQKIQIPTIRKIKQPLFDDRTLNQNTEDQKTLSKL